MAPALINAIIQDIIRIPYPIFFFILFVGVIASYRVFGSALSLLYKFTYGKKTNFAKYGARKGGWALVTGASDGIGKQFAIQLSQKGMNVILAARRKEKLDEVAAALAKDVEHKIVILDVSDPSHQGWTDIVELQKELESKEQKISVLVNNAGVSYDFPTPFEELTQEKSDQIIDVNCKAVMRITRIIMPAMLARKNGLVLNLGSCVGQIPVAYLAVYSGSKGFLKYWSMAVGQEAKEKGVQFENLNTWFVSTAMSKIRKATWDVPTADDYVRHVLSYCGQGHLSWTPYPSHALFAWIVDNVASRRQAMEWFWNSQKAIREFALAKKKKKMEEARKAAEEAAAKA
ncbi:NAD(P)-binding protein [Gonapodya prolifera JEL478]|uniref:NAD(P)-binding protein n=1 Tax=Gonapodya prolifera (strain JEL478) TaxID=1344416 RepID=A0A139AW22_GONPJ|nr:NAD(P)-binding protein [Gonapodya prolifera JEL478]|eukprot:KXS20783.1 NAD(P)-binding protein [Gonapodya prolifera JEL478]